MKEEWKAILAGLGMLVVIVVATAILKKLFNNITTSGALLCVFVLVGMSFLIVLLAMEYFDYRVRKNKEWKGDWQMFKDGFALIYFLGFVVFLILLIVCFFRGVIQRKKLFLWDD